MVILEKHIKYCVRERVALMAITAFYPRSNMFEAYENK